MSTNSECMIIEIEPAKWWYVLEDIHAPQNMGDWRKYATATGPFPTEEKALEDLDRCHPNPGSFCTYKYDPSYVPDEVMKRLMKEYTERHRFC